LTKLKIKNDLPIMTLDADSADIATLSFPDVHLLDREPDSPALRSEMSALLNLPDRLRDRQLAACVISVRPRALGSLFEPWRDTSELVQRLHADSVERMVRDSAETGEPPEPLLMYAYPDQFPIDEGARGLFSLVGCTMLWIGEYRPDEYLLSRVIRSFPAWAWTGFDFALLEEAVDVYHCVERIVIDFLGTKYLQKYASGQSDDLAALLRPTER